MAKIPARSDFDAFLDRSKNDIHTARVDALTELVREKRAAIEAIKKDGLSVSKIAANLHATVREAKALERGDVEKIIRAVLAEAAPAATSNGSVQPAESVVETPAPAPPSPGPSSSQSASGGASASNGSAQNANVVTSDTGKAGEVAKPVAAGAKR